MKYVLTIHGQEHALEVRGGDLLVCSLDGTPFSAEVAEVRTGLYSMLIGRKSFAVRVGGDEGEYEVQIEGASYRIAVADPRRRRRGGPQIAIEGRQTVRAPMPGKVIRLLVAKGEAVEAGQGVLVIEAMKMQNEVKSPKAGTVQKVSVQVGQAVNAGETLVIVE